ncbi:MAG: Ig-like domain-containing protein, partial [bacterium]
MLFAAHIPTVEITSPGAGEDVSGTIPVVANYSIDNGNIHSLTLFAAGNEVLNVDVHRREGVYTFNLNTANYPDGSLEIKVRACSADENSGHCSTDTVNVVLDNNEGPEAPWIEIMSPESGETVSGSVIVSASFEFLYNYTRNVYLYANGVEAGRVSVSVKKGSVTYSLDTTRYPDGPLALMVSECPPSGGSEWCRRDTVNITVDNVEEDTEAPEIAITDPAANELIGVKPVLVAAELTDNVAVNPSTVVVKLDGTAVTAQCTVTAVSVNCTLNPAEGTHALTVEGRDINNNSAIQKSVNFTVDTVAPNVTVISHTNGQTVNTAAINLAGTAGDATSGVASVEVNGTAATLNGGNWTLNNFALEEGANVIAVVAEDRAEHAKTVVLSVTYVRIICRADADCGDSDALTIDKCINPGTGASRCENTQIACNTNADCAGDARFCVEGGTAAAVCAECRNNGDCNDSNAHTEDVCVNGGTAASACANNAIECLNDAECNDNNRLTLDKCNNAGAAQAFCSNDPLICATDTDCNDGEALTLDKCNHPGTAQSSCAHVSIECNNNNDCNDDNSRTQDACSNGGTVASVCAHSPITCLSDNDCSDDNALTLDKCKNAGTIQSTCANTGIECNVNADCADNEALTLDTCANGGTATAACNHAAIACNTNSDCDDDNARTQDACSNGGTVASACAHNPIACLNDADCGDGNELTIDSCANPGTVQSACVGIEIECNTSADCDDHNARTLDTCTNGGTASASCAHNDIACLNDADCNDQNNRTLDKCNSAGTAQAFCANDPLACNADEDCGD